MIPIAPGHDTLIHRCCKKTIALMATHDPSAISFACDECIGWLDFHDGCWHWSDGIAHVTIRAMSENAIERTRELAKLLKAK